MIPICRIWGISYKEYEEDLTTAQIAGILFPALVRQGPHAYGWAQWIPGDGVSWEKHPGRCDSDQALTRIVEGVSNDAYWVIGHTRWATTGSPSENRNNHPIPHGDVIGVHNGVLSDYQKILDVTGREDNKSEVDSEAIFAAVNKWGHVKGLRKVKGSMVAVYTKLTDPEAIFVARSTGRQLTLGWTDKGNLIFASEKEALLQLQPEVKFVRFSTVSEDRILEIRYGDIVARKNLQQKKTPARVAVSSAGTSLAVPNRDDYFQTNDLATWLQSRGYGRTAAIEAYLERRRDQRLQERMERSSE